MKDQWVRLQLKIRVVKELICLKRRSFMKRGNSMRRDRRILLERNVSSRARTILKFVITLSCIRDWSSEVILPKSALENLLFSRRWLSSNLQQKDRTNNWDTFPSILVPLVLFRKLRLHWKRNNHWSYVDWKLCQNRKRLHLGSESSSRR